MGTASSRLMQKATLLRAELHGTRTRLVTLCPLERGFLIKDGSQVWGIEIINDEKRYVRHVDFLGPGGESVQTKLIYDYSERSILFGVRLLTRRQLDLSIRKHWHKCSKTNVFIILSDK